VVFKKTVISKRSHPNLRGLIKKGNWRKKFYRIQNLGMPEDERVSIPLPLSFYRRENDERTYSYPCVRGQTTLKNVKETLIYTLSSFQKINKVVQLLLGYASNDFQVKVSMDDTMFFGREAGLDCNPVICHSITATKVIQAIPAFVLTTEDNCDNCSYLLKEPIRFLGGKKASHTAPDS
jgi:hypothetical protein